jgi:hypothetical protein
MEKPMITLSVSLHEDEEVLHVFDERADEPTISFEEFLEILRSEGKLETNC